MIKISVIIPCYNYGRFLPDACESLLAQTMVNWECILINNGRFPETMAAAKVYLNADQRFKYLETDSGGPSLARNIGLKIAQGEYIQFLDADDKLSSGRFELLANIFEKESDLDLIYSDLRYFTTDNKNNFHTALNGLSSAVKSGYNGSGNELYNVLIRKNIFAINTPLIRKSILDKTGGFSDEFNFLEDWDFWLRSSKHIRKFKYVGVKEVYAFVRSHSTSLSTNNDSMRSHFLPVLFSNIVFNRLSLRNIFIVYIIGSEFILDRIFSGTFKTVWPMLISTAHSFENYLIILIHFILLPVYLPLYILLKMYRKFAR